VNPAHWNRTCVLVLLLSLLTLPVAAQTLPTSLTEREVKVGTGEWAIDGTLTLPKGKGPFPAVLLVPGSGMGDRDVTVGPNKIFRDVAWGLASRGIVVLRAEKRLSQHVEKFRSRRIMPSIRTEVIDDGVTGVEFLRSVPEVDKRRVYVLGHSQGATFAPQIANEAGNVAGVVIVAGSTRKPGEMIEEQAAHVLATPNISEEERKGAEQAMAGAKQMRHLPDKDDEFVLGMPASYWRYFYQYDAAAEAAKLKGRVLVIRNGRDYQVTEKDFSGYQKALAGRPNATLKVYPRLNHLMQEAKGNENPDDYEKLGGPSPEVIADVANWLLKD
jgi:uncharacterized protein